MKKTILINILMVLIMLSLVSAADYTFRQNTNVDLKIPCFDTNNDFCDSTTNCTITINQPNGNNIVNNQNMTRNSAYYNYSLNSSQTSAGGIYDVIINCVNPTYSGFDRFDFETTASGKEQKTSTAGLAIVVFVLFIVAFLLAIGFRQRITTNELVDLIIRRSCFLLAIYFMILNSTMVATIAGAANIDLTREMFAYVSIFGYLGYAAMIYLLFKTLIDYLSIWNERKNEKRGF